MNRKDADMKKPVFAVALAAAALAFSGLALAEHGDLPDPPAPVPGQYRGMHRGPAQGQMQDNRNARPMQGDRGPGPGANQQYPRQGPGYEGRGAGPQHNFYRGGRLPPQYRNHQYVVDDWRGHHLNAPPRGYQWVQTGGDYVLVAIATGIIAQILLSQ